MEEGVGGLRNEASLPGAGQLLQHLVAALSLTITPCMISAHLYETLLPTWLGFQVDGLCVCMFTDQLASQLSNGGLQCVVHMLTLWIFQCCI